MQFEKKKSTLSALFFHINDVFRLYFTALAILRPASLCVGYLAGIQSVVSFSLSPNEKIYLFLVFIPLCVFEYFFLFETKLDSFLNNTGEHLLQKYTSSDEMISVFLLAIWAR